MRESKYCTKSIVSVDGQMIPECFANLASLSQENRNYLTCQTYNLGLYNICKTCTLSCHQNSNNSNPILNILNLLGLDEDRKSKVMLSLNQLKTSEFSDVISILEGLGKLTSLNNPDLAKAILHKDRDRLQKILDEAINSGKITKEQLNDVKNRLGDLKSMIHSSE